MAWNQAERSWYLLEHIFSGQEIDPIVLMQKYIYPEKVIKFIIMYFE